MFLTFKYILQVDEEPRRHEVHGEEGLCNEAWHCEGGGEAGGEHGQGAAAVHHQIIQREHPEKHPHVQREADQEVDRDGIRHHEKRV